MTNGHRGGNRHGVDGPLRIASYNIHRAVGADKRRDPGRIARVIRELDADAVGLQEVDWHHDGDNRHSQFEFLAQMPGYQAIAGPNLRDHRGHYGNLLLTRLEVTGVERIDLSEGAREPRGAIDVDLRAGGLDIRVIITHLGLGVRERSRQAVRLRDLIAGRPGRPALLVGDLNEWIPGSPTLRPLLRLCGARRPHPRSYPAARPVFALDRILTYGFCAEPHVRTHRSPLARAASDHLPVIAEFDRLTAGRPPNSPHGSFSVGR